MDFLKMDADMQRKELRSNIWRETVAAVQAHDNNRIEASIKRATDEWLLETAELIRGYKAHNEKDFLSALEYYEKALRLDPSFAPAHVSKIAVLIAMERLDEAVKSADYAISHLMLLDFAPYYYNKGVALERLKRFEEAIYCYFRAIEDNANYLGAYSAVINTLSRLEDWPRFFSASALFKETLKDKPSPLDAIASLLLQLTEIQFRQGRVDLANSLLQEAGEFLVIAAKKEPKNTSVLYNLACFYSRSGSENEAIETLKKAFGFADEAERKRLKDMSRADVDFANIRENSNFKDLVSSP